MNNEDDFSVDAAETDADDGSSGYTESTQE